MTLIDKAEPHDDDLIRRGDALAAVYEADSLELVQHGENRIADRIAALPAVTVGVKPLVWRSNGKGRVCADTPFGLYEVEHGRYGMRLLHSGSFMQDDLQGIDAAKAAAQADYEARILAALEPVAAPDPAEIRGAYRDGWDFAYRQWEATGSVPPLTEGADDGRA